MPDMPRVLIVGAGIAGLSTAWALARRGYAVEVFEQGPVPNPRASSYDEHRITRHVYGSTGYAELMPHAFALWDRLFADIGTRHFDPLPLLVLQRERDAWFASSKASLDSLNVPYRAVQVETLAESYPMLSTEGVSAAFVCEGAGVLFPIRILIDLSVHLASLGVVFHANTKVTAVDLDAGTVTVDGGVRSGDVVVVAAGAWAERLVPALRALATPSRQAVLFLAPPPALADAWRDAPVILDIGAASGTYALPPRPGTRLKIGDHLFTRIGDPDDDRLAMEEDLAQLFDAARLAFRDFDAYRILERKICYYTVTDDERFVVRPLGRAGYIQSACSGHGFKLGPLIGEGVARAIAGETAAGDLAEWAAARPVRVA